MRPGPDWTRLILVRSSLEFWDQTIVKSPKKLGLDYVVVRSQFLRLNGPSLGEKDQIGLYAMVVKVGIVIQSDLELMNVTPRHYS